MTTNPLTNEPMRQPNHESMNTPTYTTFVTVFAKATCGRRNAVSVKNIGQETKHRRKPESHKAPLFFACSTR